MSMETGFQIGGNDNDIAPCLVIASSEAAAVGEITGKIAARVFRQMAVNERENGADHGEGDRKREGGGEHLELPRIMEGEPQAADGERGEQDREGGHAATSGMENVPALMAAMSARISG
jgi:hypothetical protein